jgi:multidrug resistance efflux pump
MHLLKKLNFAVIVFLIGTLIAILYLLTYLVPVTDNAFVISNITPVAAMVDGYVTKIYVQNGQKLKTGDPILMVHQAPYQLAYRNAKAQYDQAQVGLKVLNSRIEVTKSALNAAQDQLARMNYEYQQKSDKSVSKAIPLLELKSLEYNIKSQQNTVVSLSKQVKLETQELQQALVGIESLQVGLEKAQMDLDDTIVRAKSDGYIQNMFVGIGTPVRATDPLFSFIDTKHIYIQANFNETDLAKVRAEDKVLIFPRTYLGHKVFHGEIMSDFWSVSRQHTLPLEQTQVVINENKWLLLPQRLPVQIRITDPSMDYPLRPGMSAYVYVKTK